ncbi:lipopolysaccharide transport system ATP-binding protein [Gillisia sp. Hel1_33_143]|uniref:ABC transporter ATP-binding protein n=1 Tax=Gillisia sp. Hel1_33_143 TaxID=1336796 RepID=UPI00087B5CBC|nr:ABC transporter ATP-binding protein [Gillisia sp. Hel1_33_143]SDS23125.1 lipopolysaccharide transport system ATP-binding protein [Gillisia sp. Hel1_33_143]
MSIILKAENISKQYRLGTVGTGTLSHDLNRWWHSIRGKEDPYLKIGGVNDRSLKASEDYVWALKDINFEVNQGEVLGIIGKNGAGKSTLLKILSRVTAPSTGIIKTKGRIASLLEVGTGFHPELTGRENIYLNGAILGMTKSEITTKLDEIIDFSGCEMYIDTPVKRYSSGMTVRLGFAVAAHLEPEILVVDEVLAVGDAEFQKKAIGKMKDLSKGQGRTVIFVSHNMDAVKSLCSRGIVLGNGNLIFTGSARDSVEYYLNNFKSISKKECLLDHTHRRNNTTNEVEMVKITSHNNLVTLEIPLNFSLSVIKNIRSDVEVSITGTVLNMNELEIGSFFTPSVNITQHNSVINFIIENHNLSPGEYYLNFSVATGSLENSNFIILDQAFEAIGFEILDSFNNGVFTKWSKSWGDIHFKSDIKIDEI